MKTLAALAASTGLVFLVGSCSKKDECEQFVDKVLPVMEELVKDVGKGKQQPIKRDDMVASCRDDAKRKDDPMFRCVLDASDRAAVAACTQAAFVDYQTKGKTTEAELLLNKLGKNLKVSYIESSRFPTGKAELTPPTRCCEASGHKCAPGNHWDASPWKELEFRIDEAHSFQYSYESDGKTATIMAVGDLDCDLTSVTYTLTARVAEGNPVVDIAKPTNDD